MSGAEDKAQTRYSGWDVDPLDVNHLQGVDPLEMYEMVQPDPEDGASAAAHALDFADGARDDMFDEMMVTAINAL